MTEPTEAGPMTSEYLRTAVGVVHVGANSGQERDLYRSFGLRVAWVEPIEEVFTDLKRNIASYPYQTAFQALLTDQDDVEYTFNIANNGGSSSIFDFGLHRDIWPQINYVSARKLRSTTLPTLFRRENLTVAMYPALVMDVQGAELLVLKGAEPLLGEFKLIKAEAADFESYIGGATLRDLEDYLTPFGFQEIQRDAFAHRSSGGTYYDVVWAKRA
jgi:FkbM family methyltransferase